MNIDSTTYFSVAKNFRQRFLILHYTAQNFATSVSLLTESRVSVHYLIPTLKSIDPTYPNDELVIYNLVHEMERAWHAGASSWGNINELNDSSIGVEIVNMSNDIQSVFVPYPEEQIQLVIGLCRNILARYPDITPTHVLGHADIALGRKKDPGPLFPWYTLFQAGIGAWFDQPIVEKYIEQFNKKMPSISDVVEKLSQYGYSTAKADPRTLFTAFQMHFRPQNYQGELDVETAAIAYALCDKYKTTFSLV